MGPGKIYTIDAPALEQKPAPVPPPDILPRSEPVPTAASPTLPGQKTARWRTVLLAYALGPINVVSWAKGSRRAVWTVLGPGSVAAGALLMAYRSPLTDWLETSRNGLLLWMAVFPPLLLSLATAWARAIAAAGRHRPMVKSQYASWMRDPRALAALGLLVPGLGLMIAGRRKRAAWAFWILGPLAIAALVLARWRWLWDRSHSDVPPGISPVALEVVFAIAAGVGAAALLAWIVQALDGARHVSAHRPRLRTDLASLALLIALAAFAASFRPASVAQKLHTATVALQIEGFRLIPLVLCETSLQLDPASPVYLVQSALLNDQLGRTEAAAAKWSVIERRATEYLDLARSAGVIGKAPLEPVSEAPAPHAVPLQPAAADTAQVGEALPPGP